MKSEETIAVLGIVVLIVSLLIAGVLKSLADAVTGFLLNIGVPVSLAQNINSILFFGGLVAIFILLIKNIPRLSRI